MRSSSTARRTTFSGVAIASSRLFSGQIRQILNWPGSYETFRKVPTCIAYYQASPSDEAQIIAWGLEASSLSLREGFFKQVTDSVALPNSVLVVDKGSSLQGRVVQTVSRPSRPSRWTSSRLFSITAVALRKGTDRLHHRLPVLPVALRQRAHCRGDRNRGGSRCVAALASSTRSRAL